MSPARKTSPQPVAPDLSPEKAYSLLSTQLEALQELKRLGYRAGEAKEDEWRHFTTKIIIRAFGSDSLNKSSFSRAASAGEYYITPYGGENPALDQRNFEARLRAYEGALNSSLAELRIDIPEPEIKGVFAPGEEYEFYVAVKTILGFAGKEVFVIDPYLSVEMFDVYAAAISRSITFRLLGANVPSAVLTIAQKYASGGNLQFRSSSSIHDRVLFSDDRVWLCGQSLKDAAKKKPTYIVEHDGPLMKPIYESIWAISPTLI